MSSQNEYVDEKHLCDVEQAILRYARKNSVGLPEIRGIIKCLNDKFSTYRSAEEISQNRLNKANSLYGVILSASGKMNKPRLPLYSFYARVTLADEDPAHPTRLLGYVDPYRSRFYFADEERVPGFIEIEEDTKIECCTGLCDDPLRPIFEGDRVVHLYNNKAGTVKFSDDEWKFVVEWDDIGYSNLNPFLSKHLLILTPKE